MGKKSIRLIFSTILIFTLGGGVAQAAAWKNFTSNDGGFQVMMPGTPQLQQNTHKSFVGAIEENTYMVNTKDGSYSVEYSNLPNIAVSMGGAGAIFDGAKKGLLKDSGGKQVSFSDITLNGNPGKELVYQIPSVGADTMGKARFYLVQKRLYVLVATGSKASQFFNSFKLLNP